MSNPKTKLQNRINSENHIEHCEYVITHKYVRRWHNIYNADDESTTQIRIQTTTKSGDWFDDFQDVVDYITRRI